LDRPTGTIYPDGAHTGYTYDAANNLATSTNARGQTTAYTHDALNQLVAVAYPDHTVTYADYPNGQTEAITDTSDSTGIASVSQYGIDAMGRVITATTPQGAITYTYDGAGNRTGITTPGGTTAYTYDADNRLSTVTDQRGQTTTYTHDADGNQTSRTAGSVTTLYTYDSQNQLRTVGISATLQASYLYDPLGNRVSTMDGQGHITAYLFDTQAGLAQAVRETPSAGAPTDYVYGLNRVGLTRGGATSNYLYDGHGNTEALIDAGSGATVQDTYRYDAYGNLLAQTGNVANSFLYDGQQFDANTGLYDLRARYMDPTTGRFLQQDPLHGSPQDPSALHRYLYARDNPVTYADPSGQEGDIAEEETVFSLQSSLIKAGRTLLNFFGSKEVAIVSTGASIGSAIAQVKVPASHDNLDVADATTDLYGTNGSNFLNLTACRGAPGATGTLASNVTNSLGALCNFLGIISVQDGIVSLNPNSAVLSAGLLPQLLSFQIGGPAISIGVNITAFLLITAGATIQQEYVQKLPFKGAYVNEEWQSYVAGIANLYIVQQLVGLIGTVAGGAIGSAIGTAVSVLSAALAIEIFYDSSTVLYGATLTDTEANVPSPPRTHLCGHMCGT